MTQRRGSTDGDEHPHNNRPEHIAVGFSDLSVSRLGFGGCPIGGHGWGRVDDAESVEAIRTALECGVDFFDTADIYGLGHSEEILSKSLGRARHDVVIATKFGVKRDVDGVIFRDISERNVRQALEGSLRRLRIDSIPLYQVHWPDGKTPIIDVMDVLKLLQKEGKIQHIGVCNFSEEQIREAHAVCGMVSVQVPYNVIDRRIEDGVLPCCKELGIAVITYSSLAQGLLSGKYGPADHFGQDDLRSRSPYFAEDRRKTNLRVVACLKEVGRRYEKTPTQVAIRWILDTPGIAAALTGIKTSEQVKENSDLNWILSEADYSLIESAGRVGGTDGS